MKLLGTLLIAFGTFFLLVATLVLLAPGLRVNGIDVSAATTSVQGSFMIGGFALLTGALLRRRAHERGEAKRLRRERQGELEVGMPAVPLADRAPEVQVPRDRGR
ncbi:MAG TPA: hypothetical protein VGD77_05020 [Gemmatimonadaceae bacterium]|jgi:hypothetical protein